MSHMSGATRCARARRNDRRGASRGRFAVAVVTAALALLLASCSSSHTVSPTTITPPSSVANYNGPGWILSFDAFLELINDPAAKLMFDNPKTFVIVSSADAGALKGWKVTLVVDFKSYALMEHAFATGGIPTGVSAIMYDNEDWSYTPAPEQLQPAHYEQLAAELIHSHGLKFLATPGADLSKVLDSNGTGNQYQRYLSLDLAGEAAKYADILNIQAQGEEGDATAYARFLTSAIAKARAANPNIVIYAGISTARSSDPNAMFNAVQATKSQVTGYWLNVITSTGGAAAVTLAENFVNSVASSLHLN